ncbi:MAG: hypothetical protein HC945_02595 [Nitrosarchaeum sp.]|nr:hypothetical protein [Nitrosarchaeum sp.]
MARIITGGCPICGSDVRGTNTDGYYCKACNILFRRRNLARTHAKNEAQELLTHHFSDDYRTIQERYEDKGFTPVRLTKDTAHLRNLRTLKERQIRTIHTLENDIY